MEYAYKVRDSRGKMLKGTQEAEDRDSLIRYFINQGYYIVSLQEANRRNPVLSRELFPQRVSPKEILIITRQFLTMLSAGFTIISIFKTMGDKAPNRVLKKTLRKIHDDIEQGSSLGKAFSQHPQIFPGVYVNMVKAGEMGGTLEAVLENLVLHLEREQYIKAKIRNASIYPLIVALAAILVMSFIVAFIMPAFVHVFESAGAEIPLPTQLLLGFGLFLGKYWLALLLSVMAFVLILRIWKKTEQGKYFRDKALLRFPLWGTFLSRIMMAHFARVMAILLQAGIPILQALDISAGVVKNEVIVRAVRQAGQEIKAGYSISKQLESSGIFDSMFTEMVAIGEESGSLDTMFAHIADYYEQEVLYTLSTLLKTIEPIMIITVALLVGGIVMATILPVFDLIKVVA